MDWAKENNHILSSTKFHLSESLPQKMDFDLLVVMGGPMNIYEYDTYPFLEQEKEFIKTVIEKGISTLGICLGAQLIADVLGAKIKPNKDKEIGWFPIEVNKGNNIAELIDIFQTDNPVLHWHGDTFEIPKGAKRLAKSEVCENQAFVYNNNIFGLQYHLEMSETSLQTLIENSKDELVNAPYIQTEVEMLNDRNRFKFTKEKLYALLNYIERRL